MAHVFLEEHSHFNFATIDDVTNSLTLERLSRDHD
jgi:hypothetical protein